jgi:hypothetical protein
MNIKYENCDSNHALKNVMKREFANRKIKDSTSANMRIMFKERFPDLADKSAEVCEVFDVAKSFGAISVERDVTDVNGIIVSC